MAETREIVERVGEIAADVARRSSVEFIQAQIVGSKRNPIVRLIIDRPGGVTLDDCAKVSREVEAILDRDDFIPTSYVLEVSSPGIERELFTLGDYERFAGQTARVRTQRSIDGQRNFTGTIKEIKDESIVIADRTRGDIRIPFVAIEKGNLVVDLMDEFKKGQRTRNVVQ
jgi:ribosome maturation factor RimP